MVALARLVVVAAAAGGAIVASQLPEFAQQYRQRLGGALEEMRAVVADFESDAARSSLSPDQALKTYERSGDTFVREQGVSMRGNIARYEHLADQRERLEGAPPLMRPVVVLSGPDERVTRGAWADFEPGVPVTTAGFVWAALGFFLFGGLVSAIIQIAAAARRRGRRVA